MTRLQPFMMLLAFGIFKFITTLETDMLGPADFIFKSFGICEDTEDSGGLHFNASQRKFNRSMYLLDVSFETKYDINNNLTLELQGSMKKDGGYKQGSMYLKEPICDALKIMLGSVYEEFLSLIGIYKCPIPPGFYHVQDFYFDNSKFDMPHLFGDYMVKFQVFAEEKLINCFEGYYELRPKETDE